MHTTTPHTSIKEKMAEETRDDEEPLIQNESSIDDGEDEGEEDDQQKDNFLDVIGNFGVYQLGSTTSAHSYWLQNLLTYSFQDLL